MDQSGAIMLSRLSERLVLVVLQLLEWETGYIGPQLMERGTGYCVFFFLFFFIA